MHSYMDKTYAAAGNCLLSYTGMDVALNIPGRFANMSIEKIGDGCFMETGSLQQVVVPQHVKEIGEKAFYRCDHLYQFYLPGCVEKIGSMAFAGCKELFNLIFYDLPVSDRCYETLKSSSVKADGGIRLTTSFPAIPVVQDAVRAMGFMPACLVPSGIGRLFIAHDPAETIGEESLSRNLERLEFSGLEGPLTEENSFNAFLADPGLCFELDPKAEEQNDTFIRLNQYPSLQKTAVFCFDDSKTKNEGECRKIWATVKVGYFFWQSQIPLRVRGRQYYIYRRHYLMPEEKLSYFRQDTAVFSQSGLVKNKREAQAVYAKYKLLSIL